MHLETTIQRNIRDAQAELGDDYWELTAAELTLVPAIEDALAGHAGGRLLDAGAGNLLYRPILARYCETYESLDVSPAPGLDHREDLQDTSLPDDAYDTVFCRHVLEHVPRPDRALAELHRVCKPGGTAIVTVPHLAYLHNEPDDYFRYTEHGLRRLLEDAGFDVEQIVPVGGLGSFLGYSIGTLLVGTTFHLPLVSSIALAANGPLQRLAVALDDATGNEAYFPFNYLAVATKRESRAGGGTPEGHTSAEERDTAGERGGVP